MARVDLNDLNVEIGGNSILSGVSLTVEDGECLALLGPSGCGKTTTLRAIAGFVRLKQGVVQIGPRRVDLLPPHKRNVGLVFQDYALFPHMTVTENVAYGLRMRGIDRSKIHTTVKDSLAMVQLADMGERYPEELSGGQRQRVGLARAIVVKPDVLLLDEPLGALDRKLRDEMQVELKRLQRDLGITTIIVTHDQEEALSLSNRVAVMFRGSIAAVASPTELYQRPHTAEIMAFLGRANFFEAWRQAGSGTLHYATSLGISLQMPEPPANPPPSRMRVGIRPEHVRVRPGVPDASQGESGAVINEVIYRGSSAELVLQAGDSQVFSADVRTADFLLRRGDSVAVRFPAQHAVVF